MNAPGPSFHLLLEPTGASATPDAPPTTPPRLEIPEGVTFLESTDEGPSLRPAGVATSSIPLVVQPVREGPFPILLLLVPGGRRVIVNGTPAPPVSLLEEGDEVLFDDGAGPVAHVALYHRPSVGPPQPGEVGATCPLCLVAITPDTTLYRCFHCGKPLHLEPETRAAGERLECARLCTECPSCHTPIRMETGYGRLPEFYRGEAR